MGSATQLFSKKSEGPWLNPTMGRGGSRASLSSHRIQLTGGGFCFEVEHDAEAEVGLSALRGPGLSMFGPCQAWMTGAPGAAAQGVDGGMMIRVRGRVHPLGDVAEEVMQAERIGWEAADGGAAGEGISAIESCGLRWPGLQIGYFDTGEVCLSAGIAALPGGGIVTGDGAPFIIGRETIGSF